MAVGDIIEITDCQTLHGTEISNVYEYQVVTDATSGAIDNPEYCAKAFEQDVISLFLAGLQSDEVNHHCVKAQKVHPSVGPSYEHTISVPGAVVAEPVPVNVMCVCGLYSVEFGKKGRGRKYIAGLPQNQMEKGDLGGLAWGNFQNNMVKLLDLIDNGGGEYRLVIWSRNFPVAKVVTSVMTRSRVKGLRPRTRQA